MASTSASGVGGFVNPDLVSFRLRVDEICVLRALLGCELSADPSVRNMPDEVGIVASVYHTLGRALDYYFIDEPEDS